MVEQTENTFEMSLRVLGNEFLGFKIQVNDFKSKWLILSLLATGGFSAIIATFGEPIKALFGA